MKISVDEMGNIVLEEVFEPIILKTEENSHFVICMRDNTVEMKITGFGKWYRANMKDGTIGKL